MYLTLSLFAAADYVTPCNKRLTHWTSSPFTSLLHRHPTSRSSAWQPISIYPHLRVVNRNRFREKSKKRPKLILKHSQFNHPNNQSKLLFMVSSHPCIVGSVLRTWPSSLHGHIAPRGPSTVLKYSTIYRQSTL